MVLIRTLVLSGGGIHDSQSCGDALEQVLRAEPGFEVTRLHDNLSILVAPGLDSFDALVLYWTRGEINDAQKNGLLNWVASGKGFIGIHSAVVTFIESPEYLAMVGGRFLEHPPIRRYQVSIVDPQHPITEGLEEFFVEDEQYVLDYDPRVQVLASALWRGSGMPVAWAKHWGLGRVFYLALGHFPDSCRGDEFRAMLTRGVRWASGL